MYPIGSLRALTVTLYGHSQGRNMYGPTLSRFPRAFGVNHSHILPGGGLLSRWTIYPRAFIRKYVTLSPLPKIDIGVKPENVVSSYQKARRLIFDELTSASGCLLQGN